MNACRADVKREDDISTVCGGCEDGSTACRASEKWSGRSVSLFKRKEIVNSAMYGAIVMMWP